MSKSEVKRLDAHLKELVRERDGWKQVAAVNDDVIKGLERERDGYKGERDNALTQWAKAERERDEYWKRLTNTGSVLAEQITENERLRKAIEDAEHAEDCSSLVREGESKHDDAYYCDCFKSEVTE